MLSEFVELCDVQHWGLIHGRGLLPSDVFFLLFFFFTSLVSSCILSTLTSPLSLRLGIFDSTVLLMLQLFDSTEFRYFY